MATIFDTFQHSNRHLISEGVGQEFTNGSIGVSIAYGSTDPEGALAASAGSKYYRTNGTEYIKTGGTYVAPTNTGWTILATGTGTTNLAVTPSATTVIVTSDTGTDATIAAADGTNAGLMVPAQFDKLGFVTVTQAVDLDTMEADVADLTTLTGVASNATDYGTFTGSIITDASNNKTILQELETAIEAIILDGNETAVVRGNATTGVAPTGGEIPTPVSGDTGSVFLNDGTFEKWVYTASWALAYTLTANQAANLGVTPSATNVIVTSSTGTDATLPLGTTTNAGLLAPAQFDELAFITVTQAVDLDELEAEAANLVILSGVASDATDLGTFAGTTISDNVVNKVALQELETAVEQSETFAANIGDGATTSIVVNHAIGTQDVHTTVRYVATNEVTHPRITHTDANNTTFDFSIAPTAAQFRVVISKVNIA